MALSLLTTASLLTFIIVPSTYAADPVVETSTSYEVGSVVVTTNYTEENTNPIVTPFYLLQNYSFGPLSSNDYTTKEWFNHYSYGDITIKLAQYPTYGSGTVAIEYTLRAAERGSIPVAGNYSSATKTITFPGVQAGSYALQITNIGTTTASGYGSIND